MLKKKWKRSINSWTAANLTHTERAKGTLVYATPVDRCCKWCWSLTPELQERQEFIITSLTGTEWSASSSWHISIYIYLFYFFSPGFSVRNLELNTLPVLCIHAELQRNRQPLCCCLGWWIEPALPSHTFKIDHLAESSLCSLPRGLGGTGQSQHRSWC